MVMVTRRTTRKTAQRIAPPPAAGAPDCAAIATHPVASVQEEGHRGDAAAGDPAAWAPCAAELRRRVDALFRAVEDKDAMTVGIFQRAVAAHYGWAKCPRATKKLVRARLVELMRGAGPPSKEGSLGSRVRPGGSEAALPVDRALGTVSSPSRSKRPRRSRVDDADSADAARIAAAAPSHDDAVIDLTMSDDVPGSAEAEVVYIASGEHGSPSRAAVPEKTRTTVRVTKLSKAHLVGLVLQQDGDRVRISKISPAGLCIGTALRVGLVLESVNGQACRTSDDTAALIRAAEGLLTIVAAATLASPVYPALEAADSDSEVEFISSDRRQRPSSSFVNNVGRVGDEVEVTASTTTNANIDYPHMRHQCGIHPFSLNQSTNGKHCAKCYCFACDVPAGECPHWTTRQRDQRGHCHAHAGDAGWARRRAAAVAAIRHGCHL